MRNLFNEPALLHSISLAILVVASTISVNGFTLILEKQQEKSRRLQIIKKNGFITKSAKINHL